MRALYESLMEESLNLEPVEDALAFLYDAALLVKGKPQAVCRAYDKNLFFQKALWVLPLALDRVKGAPSRLSALADRAEEAEAGQG